MLIPSVPLLRRHVDTLKYLTTRGLAGGRDAHFSALSGTPFALLGTSIRRTVPSNLAASREGGILSDPAVI
jgi:hypothetical protein